MERNPSLRKSGKLYGVIILIVSHCIDHFQIDVHIKGKQIYERPKSLHIQASPPLYL